MDRKGISLNIPLLEEKLKTKIVLMSARKKQGLSELKQAILDYKKLPIEACVNTSVIDPEYFAGLKKAFPKQSIYKLWLVITQDVNFANVNRKLFRMLRIFTPKIKMT